MLRFLKDCRQVIMCMQITKRINNLIVIILALTLCGGCGQEKSVVNKSDYLSESAIAGNVSTESDAYRYKCVQRGEFFDEYEQAGQLYIQDSKTVDVKYEYGQLEFIEYLVKAGDYVEQGDAIASVHIEVSQADIENEKLLLARMKERLQEDIADYDTIDADKKAKAYLKSNEAQGVALREYEESVAAHSQDIASRRVLIEDEITQIAKMENAATMKEVYAPMSGYITNLTSYKRGDRIDNKTSIALVEPSESNIVSVYNEENAFRYGKSVEVVVNVKGSNMECVGTVISPSQNDLFNRMDPNRAFIRLELPEGQLLNKSDVKKITVTIKDNEMKNVLVLDRGALEESAGYATATIVTENGAFVKRRVVIGGTSKNSYWILSGLDEGDRVVVP